MSVVASFVYSENGVSLARVDRVEPGRDGRRKEFIPYLALPGGGFAKKPGLKGVKLPPYRVDEIRAAIAVGKTIYLAEGEGKGDALRDVLRKAGLAAAVTTLFGGANATFTDAHVASLSGAPNVVILADSDDPGRKAATARAQRIVAAHPACDVRIVDLYPDRPDGSDVADWLDEGHGLKELGALVDAAPRAQRLPAVKNAIADSRAPGTHGPAFVRAGTLLAESDGDGLEYVIEGLLPVGGTAILAGRPKCGKSTLGSNVGLLVTRGELFFGRRTRKGPVLYVALEGARGAWKQLLVALGVTDDDDLYLCIDRAPEAAIEWLRDAIETYHPVLVIIDTMQRLLRVKDGNDYATGSNATDAVIELARNAKVAVLMLHHSGKTRRGDLIDEVLGSTAWAAAVDTVLVLRKTERFRTLASQGRVGEDLAETVVEMDPVTRRVAAAGTKADSDFAEMGALIEQYLRQHAEANVDDDAIDEPTIDKNVEGRTETKRKALRERVAAGRIARVGSGKKGDPYRYKLSCSLVPDYGWEQENENRKSDANACEIGTDSCSLDSDGRPAPEGELRVDGSTNAAEAADALFAYATERIPQRDDPPTQAELDL
jgi:hypothetical protein